MDWYANAFIRNSNHVHESRVRLPFCANCGKELPPAALFCPNCGTEVKVARASHIPHFSNMDLASLGQRIVASVIDDIILFVAIGLVVVILVTTGLADLPAYSMGSMEFEVWRTIHPLMWVAALSIPLLYYVCLEGASGQTLGKRVIHIMVVRASDESCGYLAAFLRNILRFVDNLFLGLIGVVLIATTNKRQRIGDFVAGTIVVKS